MTSAGTQSTPLPWAPSALAVLTCLWIIGTATLIIAATSSAFAEWPDPPTPTHQRASGWYLLSAMTVAVAVPVAAAVLAYLSRQFAGALGYALVGMVVLILAVPVVAYAQRGLAEADVPVRHGASTMARRSL